VALTQTGIRRVAVMRAEDLAPGERATVDAFGRTVVVFNLDGKFVAFDNRCPHHGGPLRHGRLSGTWLASEPCERRWGADGHILACPWHAWEFDLAVGRAVFDPRVRLVQFATAVEDGEIVVYDQSPDERAGAEAHAASDPRSL
jgi:3-phenylpropionate/trans-cinnamate dioxygenase ferredoxin subunit